MWDIKKIESLTGSQAKEIAEMVLKVKGYDVYFIDFGGYFGYSKCVFYGENHCFHADDYELHHGNMGLSKAELTELYIRGIHVFGGLGNIDKMLFDDAEMDVVNGYTDYDKKLEYIRDVYSQREKYVSVFQLHHNEEERRAYAERVKDMYLSRVAYAYYDDWKFVESISGLRDRLEAAKEKVDRTYEYLKDGFLYEMFNHEYGINYQRNYDVLSCFGNIVYSRSVNDLDDYFEQLGYGETEKLAYRDARKEYFRRNGYDGY